jgi:hypothetical protein
MKAHIETITSQDHSVVDVVNNCPFKINVGWEHKVYIVRKIEAWLMPNPFWKFWNKQKRWKIEVTFEEVWLDN